MNFTIKKEQKPLIVLGGENIDSSLSNKRYDLLLTPQYYILKKEPLPFRFRYQALKVAPSVLEDMGVDEDYKFEVFQQNGEWVFVAYNPKEIIDKLKSLSLNTKNIGKIHFAQELLDSLEKPLLINSKEALKVIDETVTLVPISLLEDNEEFITQTPALSTKGFNFPSSVKVKWLDDKSLILLSVLGILLAFGWFLEGFKYKKEIDSLDMKFQNSIADSPELLSSITRENILENYKTIDTHQREIRDTLKKIGRLISKNTPLKSLTFDKRGYKAVIGLDKRKEKTILSLAKSLGFSPKIDSDELLIEGRWKR